MTINFMVHASSPQTTSAGRGKHKAKRATITEDPRGLSFGLMSDTWMTFPPFKTHDIFLNKNFTSRLDYNRVEHELSNCRIPQELKSKKLIKLFLLIILLINQLGLFCGSHGCQRNQRPERTNANLLALEIYVHGNNTRA